MVLSPHVQLGNTIVPILLRSVLLLCHLSAVSAQQRLATNVECLPYRSDEALFSTSGAKLPNCSPHRPPTERARIASAADAVLLHNNMGGVAGTYCALSNPAIGDDDERCSPVSSQLGNFGAASLYPECAGKQLDDMCHTGIGARWPRTSWDRPAPAPTLRVVRSLRKRLHPREYLRLGGHGHRPVH